MPASPSSTAPPNGGAPENTTTALYRAALGPVNTAAYLAVFERFDHAGRAGLVWNPAAALCSLNWMVFRRLWKALLVYTLVLSGLSLALWWLQSAQALPAGVMLGLWLVLLLLSVLLPGWWGSALLHAHTRQRVLRAVAAAPTVRDACVALERQAGSRRRLNAMVVCNALVAVLLLTVLIFVSVAPRRTPAPTTSNAVDVPSAPALPAPSNMVLPVSPVLPEVGPVADPEPAQGAAMDAVSLPLQPAEWPVALPEPPADPAPVATAPPRSASASVPAPTSQAPAKPVAAQGYAINVGLFAEESNARQAHARLIEAGLPAYIQEVDGANGTRSRVRVGPFADRAGADAAAKRIQSLGLEALVFKP